MCIQTKLQIIRAKSWDSLNNFDLPCTMVTNKDINST